jgi:hypothetical protein
MSELFDIYQENIKTLFHKISRILDNISINSSDKAELVLTEADSHLKESERLVNKIII